jgi:hypothetical protein
MRNGNQVALWAGVAAFFGSLLAVGIFDVLDPSKAVEYAGAFIVAAITAGGVYSKQRLDDAKHARVHAGTLVVTETGDKKMYSLEVSGDVENLEEKKEVVFKVRKA